MLLCSLNLIIVIPLSRHEATQLRDVTSTKHGGCLCGNLAEYGERVTVSVP